MYWENIALEDGQIALREVGSDKEPMVVIRFSDEALKRLQGNEVDIARVMLTAGMHAASAMEETDAVDLMNDTDETDAQRRSDQSLH